MSVNISEWHWLCDYDDKSSLVDCVGAGEGGRGAAGGEGLQELPFLQLSPWLLLAFCSWRSSFQEWSLKLEPSFQVDMVSAAKYWQGGQLPRITFHSSWIANLTKSLLDSIQSWLETPNVDSMICSHLHEKCSYFIFHCYDFLCVCPSQLLLKFLSLLVLSFSAVPIHCNHFLPHGLDA